MAKKNVKTNANMIGKLLSLQESKRHLFNDTDQPTRDEAARTGLGQIALAMQPEETGNVEEVVRVGDATSDLDQNVALAMNKSGVPSGIGSPDPSEASVAQAGPNVAYPAHNQPGPPSYVNGMVRPEDRRGTSATQTGKSFGTAPEGPDISTIGDPLLRKIFSESFKHYTEGLMWLTKNTANDIVEAERVLASEYPLDDMYKSAMKKRVQSYFEGANGWDTIRESVENQETKKRLSKKEFFEQKQETIPVGKLIGEWFANSSKK